MIYDESLSRKQKGRDNCSKIASQRPARPSEVSMLGAIIGDMVGSAYEFNNHRPKGFSLFCHRSAPLTDDTVCTIAVADAESNP